MRLRPILTAAIVLVGLATAAPASAAVFDDPVSAGRTTTLEGACVGAGRIAVTINQPTAGPVKVIATVSGVPVTSVWDGSLTLTSATGAGGGGSTLVAQTPAADGTITLDASIVAVADPIAVVDVKSEDGALACLARLRADRQFARTSCSLIDRQVSVTAVHTDDKLDVATRLKAVRVKSTWTIDVSVASTGTPEQATATRKASADGVARAPFSLAFVADRTITVTFANHAGKGCAVSLATKALPAA